MELPPLKFPAEDIEKSGFDIGVLAGSSCQEIWEEHAAKHPGVAALRLTHAETCACADDLRPACLRNYIQHLLNKIGRADYCFAMLEMLVGESSVYGIDKIVLTCLNTALAERRGGR